MPTLPCIVCDRAIEGVNNGPDWEGNQPHGGTTFTASGQYGSTIFDPMDGSFLELNICDECLAKKASNILVCRRTRPVTLDGMGIVGYEDLPYASRQWYPSARDPFNDDRRNLRVDELLNLPEGVHLNRGLEAISLIYSLYLRETN